METGTSLTGLEVVGQAYACLAAADLDGFLALSHDDFSITQDETLPWGGHHVGREGVIAFVLALIAAIDSRVTTEGIFAAGDRVVQNGRTIGTVRSNGAGFDIPECHVWTVRDGKLAEAAYYVDTAAMLAVLEEA